MEVLRNAFLFNVLYQCTNGGWKISGVFAFSKTFKYFSKILFILFHSIPNLRLNTFAIFVGVFVFSMQTMK